MAGFLKRTIEDTDSKAGRLFDSAIQVLIFLSLVSFSVETLPGLSSSARLALSWIEVGTVAVFTVEYVLRIVVADHKLRFIGSFFGVVDLLAILPFYLSTGLDLRSIRVLRFLRLFRALKLVRYSQAIQRIRVAFLLAREEFVLFFCLMSLLLYFAAVGIYYFENEAQPQVFSSVLHSLWWAVATLTTVGYGDAYPVTAGGKVFTFIILMIGLGVVAVPSGMVAAALSEARGREGEDGKQGG